MLGIKFDTEITQEYVRNAEQAIFRVLGEPVTPDQKRALEAYKDGDAAIIKRLSVMNLADSYIRSLGYLVSAGKLLPTTDTIIAEAARAAADHRRDLILQELGTELGNA